MSINLQAYDKTSGNRRSIAVGFEADKLASPKDASFSQDTRYFFKFTTSARDTDGQPFKVKIAEGLDDLVLDGQKQLATNTADAYTDINAMINDYLYDYINGHVENANGTTGVDAQAPLQF